MVTDARSLLWLFNIGAETGNAKLLRWALRIQSYDFDLEYRKGKANITADCLSRSIAVESISVASSDPDHEDLMDRVREEPTKFSDYRIVDNTVPLRQSWRPPNRS